MNKGHIVNRRISAAGLLIMVIALSVPTQTQSFAGIKSLPTQWQLSLAEVFTNATRLKAQWSQRLTRKKLGYIGAFCAVTAALAGCLYYKWQQKQELNGRLFDGIYAGDQKKVLEALAQGASVNARDFQGTPALGQASVCGSPAIVQSLLAKKADVSRVDSKGDTALLWAVAGNRSASPENRHSIVIQLLAARASVNASNNNGYTPLTYAALANPGDFTTIKLLLDSQADPLATTASDRSALDLLSTEAVSRRFVEEAIAKQRAGNPA